MQWFMHAHNPSVYRIESVFQNKVPFRSDGTEFRPKLSPSARNRRTSDGLPFRCGHPTSKGGLILHVESKRFQFCLFNYMMMHNIWWLLFDHENISKTFHLKHEKIVFWILTLFFFLWLLFSVNDDDDYWCRNLNYSNYRKLILTWSSRSWIISFFD